MPDTTDTIRIQQPVDGPDRDRAVALAREVRTIARCQGVFGIGGLVGLLAGVAQVAVFLHARAAADPIAMVWLLPASAACLAVACGAGCAMWVQRRAGQRLARIADASAVGPLVQVVQGLLPWGPNEVRAVLAHLLPQMRPADYAALTTLQRRGLHQLLTVDERFLAGRAWGADLKLAILKALEQAGDERAVPAVDYMARRAHDGRVRAAAVGCLAFLQARVDQDRATGVLLRPADAPGADSLLRPAGDVPPADPAVLLRPTPRPDEAADAVAAVMAATQ